MARPRSKSVIVTRFSAIGDVAMTIPVVYGAARRNPDVTFVMVTRRQMAPIFVNPPANLVVMDIDLKSGRYAGWLGMPRLMADLCRKYRPLALADLHDVLRTKLLRAAARLRGLRVASIDKGRADKKRLARRGAQAMTPLTPTVDRYRDVFRRLDIDPGEGFEPLFGPTGAPDASLPFPPPASRPLIGVAPFAAHPGKVYPIELIRETIDALLVCKPRARFYLFGGGRVEAEELQRLAARYPDGTVTSLANSRLGFAREMALMSRLDVMVAMDSANMHLATLTGTPVVSVWGQTHPAAGFCPPGAVVVERTDLPCRPCSVYGNRQCPKGEGYACLEIPPADVAKAVISTLQKKC